MSRGLHSSFRLLVFSSLKQFLIRVPCCIFSINKMADPESLRTRLVEAGRVGSWKLRPCSCSLFKKMLLARGIVHKLVLTTITLSTCPQQGQKIRSICLHWCHFPLMRWWNRPYCNIYNFKEIHFEDFSSLSHQLQQWKSSL